MEDNGNSWGNAESRSAHYCVNGKQTRPMDRFTRVSSYLPGGLSNGAPARREEDAFHSVYGAACAATH